MRHLRKQRQTRKDFGHMANLQFAKIQQKSGPIHLVFML